MSSLSQMVLNVISPCCCSCSILKSSKPGLFEESQWHHLLLQCVALCCKVWLSCFSWGFVIAVKMLMTKCFPTQVWCLKSCSYIPIYTKGCTQPEFERHRGLVALFLQCSLSLEISPFWGCVKCGIRSFIIAALSIVFPFAPFALAVDFCSSHWKCCKTSNPKAYCL